MDYESGYSPSEIALNIPTLGFGTDIKDEIDMMKSLGKEKTYLITKYALEGVKRKRDKMKGIESIIDKKTQEALDARDAYIAKLEAKREKVAESRKDITPTTGLEEETYIPE